MTTDGRVAERQTAGATVLQQVPMEASCALELSREEAERRLADELRRWLAPDAVTTALDALVLARLVTHEVRCTGVHSMDAELVADLVAVRDRHRGRDHELDAFLDCILSKHDGRYWNRTYLCLPVLETLIDEPTDPLRPHTLAALLAADIVRFELCASRRNKEVSPLGRPDGRTLRTRVRHAMRFLSASLGVDAATEVLADVAHEPESALSDLLAHLPQPPAHWVAEWIEVTAQPVSTVHDEYFFLRALQSHELTYGMAADRISAAETALRDGWVDAAVTLIDDATSLVARGASLFRMIATMRREAFHTFRDFTQGASAIQSEAYKRFEARCGTPPDVRYSSPAFESVPTVKTEVSTDGVALVDVWLEADARRPGDPGVARVGASMAALETAHRRWKRAHLTVATRMLGDARGTGYTAGVPYLRSWVDHRLFWKAPALAGADASD